MPPIRATLRGVKAQDPILDMEGLEDECDPGVGGTVYFSGNWNILLVPVSERPDSQLITLSEPCGSGPGLQNAVRFDDNGIVGCSGPICPGGLRFQLKGCLGNLSSVAKERRSGVAATSREGDECLGAGRALEASSLKGR